MIAKWVLVSQKHKKMMEGLLRGHFGGGRGKYFFQKPQENHGGFVPVPFWRAVLGRVVFQKTQTNDGVFAPTPFPVPLNLLTELAV